jgi:SAM-dependent methyltransferase
MGEEWFSIATLDHFWISRRYDVLRRLTASLSGHGRRYVDVGCGYGLLQGALVRDYGCQVDGCDLNMDALLKNQSNQQCYHYDILEGRPGFLEKYDGVFALDVLEHIADETAFMEALFAMAKPGGFVCLNVPALMFLYSDYDRRVGHHRRYSIADIRRLAQKLGASIQAWSYWGLPLIPLAVVRKQVLKFVADENKIKAGFKPPGRLGNSLLRAACALEKIPNHTVGASLLVVLKRS